MGERLYGEVSLGLSLPLRDGDLPGHGLLENNEIDGDADHVEALIGEHLSLLAIRRENTSLLARLLSGSQNVVDSLSEFWLEMVVDDWVANVVT